MPFICSAQTSMHHLQACSAQLHIYVHDVTCICVRYPNVSLSVWHAQPVLKTHAAHPILCPFRSFLSLSTFWLDTLSAASSLSWSVQTLSVHHVAHMNAQSAVRHQLSLCPASYRIQRILCPVSGSLRCHAMPDSTAQLLIQLQ